jgi:hypothetical protein
MLAGMLAVKLQFDVSGQLKNSDQRTWGFNGSHFTLSPTASPS